MLKTSLLSTLFSLPILVANAQSLDSLMGGSSSQYSASISIACGDLQKSNCAQILPHIAQYSAPLGLSISPISSKGSVQSAEGVCKGVVQGAVGQHDAFSAIAQTTACAASYDVVGKPLYPYFGYLIVSAKNPANSLDDLVNQVKAGKSIQIADGSVGSGGQITFSNMLLTNANYKQAVSAVDLSWTLAEGQLQDGSLDGYFIMDSPGSPLIASIKTDLDANKKPIFKFLDVRPGSAFYNLQDWTGKPLYQEVTISENCWLCGSTKTVSTYAILILNRKFESSDANAQTVQVLQQSADSADASIRAATLTPHDWTGDQ